MNQTSLILSKGIPLYALGIFYIALSLFFPDRWNYISGCACSLVLLLACRTIGRHLFQDLPDSWLLPSGLGVVLAAVTLIVTISAGPWSLALIWILLSTAAVFQTRYLTLRLPWRYFFFAPFIALAFWSSLTPTIFYDALAYHLGLPFQYLANGRMSILQEQLYSTFPPFEQVMNLLFLGFQGVSGIKFFSMIIYCGLVHVLSELLPAEEESSPNTKFILWTSALFPAPWILIHLVTADLLASLFFCCAIASVIRSVSLRLSATHVFPALFLSFAIWTKVNCLLYGALLPILWLIMDSSRTHAQKGKKILWQVVLVFIFLSPLLIRNFVTANDPLYPALKKIFPDSSWTSEQQLALQLDSFSHRQNIFLSALETPLLLTFRKGSFGAAAEPGLVFLFGIAIYFFVRKNHLVNKILLYSFICYILWIWVFFSFRQFLPVFFLLILPSAMAIQSIYNRSRLLFYSCMCIFTVYSVFCLMPVFSVFFPLIRIKETQANYLRKYLDYAPAAEKMNLLPSNAKILFVGEARSAYVKRRSIVASRYNYNPLFEWLSQSKDHVELLGRFKKEEVQFIFCNWKEYRHLVGKSGILPLDLLPPRFAVDLPTDGIAATGNKMSRLTDRDLNILREFLSKHSVPIWQYSGVLYLYKIRDSNNLNSQK